VEYDLVVNATSRQEAQRVVDAIQQQINSGTFGNFSVDPDHPINANITMQGMEIRRLARSDLDIFLCFIIIWLDILCEIHKPWFLFSFQFQEKSIIA
jgi:hypothetical protein